MNVPYPCHCSPCACLVRTLCAPPPRTRRSYPCAHTKLCTRSRAYLVRTLCVPTLCTTSRRHKVTQPCARTLGRAQGRAQGR